MAVSGEALRTLVDVVARIRLVAFDFDGVFTDNMVYVDETGREMVRCTRADGLGLRKLESVGIKAVVVSTEENPVVLHRCRKLKIDCYHGCKDKVQVLQQVLLDQQLTFEQAAFVGNDINDEAVLRRVALPITVADAHSDVADLGLYRTHRPGGQGAVREICDQILRLRSGLVEAGR